MMIFWTSCELPDNTEVYKQGLVVFGSINMLEITDNFIQSEINAIHVSMSSAIDNNIDNANDLYINDAPVWLPIDPQQVEEDCIPCDTVFPFDLTDSNVTIPSGLTQEFVEEVEAQLLKDNTLDLSDISNHFSRLNPQKNE